MFVLKVSYDCGMHYVKDREAETLEELDFRCAELDKQWLRWYIEDSQHPKEFVGRPCGIHAGIIGFVSTLGEV